MNAIRQRWEWRTFGYRFGEAEAAFGRLTPTGSSDSDEVYLLARDADTVKVRDDLMDIKTLREVDANGLERWEPILKASFPLARADVLSLLRSLRVKAPAPERERYTEAQVFGELLAPTGAVRRIPVHKHRVRYTIGGCTSEVSDVEADGRRIRTIAIESEDAAAVIAAVRSAGLGGFANTSYPKGLMGLLEDRLPRYAVIDVGTNSVKFHIGQRDELGRWSVIIDRAAVTRLGEGLHDGGDIAPQALERTIAAIEGMVTEARANDASAVVAVGTAGLRAARNQDDVVAAIQARTGVAVSVISGEEEGRLAYLAAIARNGHPAGSMVVFDTGGGSTQFTFGHDTAVDERFSVPVGAVRYTERFGLANAVEPAVLETARNAIAADLARIDHRPTPDALIAMGGAVTNLAAVKHRLAVYNRDVVHQTVLDRAEIDRQIELYRSRDAAARREIVGLQRERADVILAGVCIVRAIMDKLDQPSLTVCDRGLRHGLLADRFGTGPRALAGAAAGAGGASR